MFLSRGNRKCKDMWIFNLPAVKACPFHVDCAKTCYALKAQRMYKTARKAREDNFTAAQRDLRGLENFLYNKMFFGKYTVCRMHESGDFFSQAYVNMWARLAARLPRIKFYAFTKTYNMWDFSKLDGLPNVNIIPSYIGGHINYGSGPHVAHLAMSHGAYVCGATAKVVGDKCNVDCTWCQTKGNKAVAFLQH